MNLDRLLQRLFPAGPSLVIAGLCFIILGMLLLSVPRV
jgi:hypothetical protein